MKLYAVRPTLHPLCEPTGVHACVLSFRMIAIGNRVYVYSALQILRVYRKEQTRPGSEMIYGQAQSGERDIQRQC